jgi:hypothetical protein
LVVGRSSFVLRRRFSSAGYIELVATLLTSVVVSLLGARIGTILAGGLGAAGWLHAIVNAMHALR